MKRLLRALSLFLLLVGLSHTAGAFTFNTNDHIQFYYDYCHRQAYLEFVFLQTQGDNDRMNYFYFKDNPSGGQAHTIIDFRHLSEWPSDATGLDTLANYSFAYHLDTNPFNFEPEFVSVYEQNDQEGNKVWIKFRLKKLPDTAIENFSASGYWRGQGSNSPDLSISTNYVLQIFGPDAPTNLTASQGRCGVVRLDWSSAPRTNCPGESYAFDIYKDGLFLHSLPASSNAQQDFYYHDYFAPSGTGIQENQHNYKVKLVLRSGSTEVQNSTFAGPVSGYPKPEPLGPSNVMATYPDCNGAVNISWQFIATYDNIRVTLTPDSGDPEIVDMLDGNATTLNETILTAPTYTVLVTGIDSCNQEASADPIEIHVPEAPGSFTQSNPVINNGNIYLDWTPSVGATSYKIVRQSSEGTKEINISNPDNTDYTDSDIRVCIQYKYRIVAENTCGSTQTPFKTAPVVTPSFDIWSNQQLLASKGYFTNRVELSWDAPDSYAFDHYKLFRKPLGTSGLGTMLGAIDKNDLMYVDVFAEAGVIYEYNLVAYSECNGSLTQSDPLTDVGFRLPVAVVNGNVKFKSGNGVPDVEISVERNAGNVGQSLSFDGQGKLMVHPKYTNNPLNVLPLQGHMTVELWLRPQDLSSDFEIFKYVNGDDSYGLSYDHSQMAFVQYFSNTVVDRATVYPDSVLNPLAFTHIAWVKDGQNLSLYIDGEPQTGTDVSYSSPGGSVPLEFGDQFVGYLDEIRYWDKSRSAEEIQGDFNKVLRGDEEDLVGYWRVDEGVGTGVYDISGIGENFNRNHLQTNNHVTWQPVFPTENQLGYVALTDSVGNYTVKNIRYTGGGNTFTVLPFYSPGGTPHEFDPVSTVLFLGEGSTVQNGVNFVDNSSFNVTGSIRYAMPDSTCDNTKAFIYIDGQIAQTNGVPAFVDPSTGMFSISVPIGLHRVSVGQSGHVFTHGGQWPPDGSLYDFQKDISGIEFLDSTRVRVIGRVVGGTREKDKKVGFGLSKNNIGIAEVTFTSQVYGCHQITIYTDSLSGEFAVDLLPVKYDVSITIPNNPDVVFPPQNVLDLSIIRPSIAEVDTMYNFAGEIIGIDSVFYNVKQNYVYRSTPEIDVVDGRNEGALEGDSVFVYVDPITFDSVVFPLMPMPYPVFIAGKRYPTIISAFEPYFNYDNPDSTLMDRVPVKDGKLTIRNGLGNSKGTGQQFDEVIQLNSPDGDTAYTFIGGQPEFVLDQMGDQSFTKTFEVVLTTGGITTSWLPGGGLYRGYVIGSKPIEGSSFITEGPETVDYILRDPPGSGSSASFNEGESYSTTKSWYAGVEGSIGFGTNLKAGTAWFIGGGVVGIGFDTKIRNDNNLKIEVKSSINADGNYTESTTFEKSISTSSQSNLTGSPMDLFMGKSENYLFGASEELTFVKAETCAAMDTCIGPTLMSGGQSFRLGKRKGLFIVPQGFKTTFIYSQYHIENVLIPNLKVLRNALFVQEPDKYVSHVSANDPGYGLNNDDPYWGAAVTSDDPLKTSVDDYDGPSYTYTYPQGSIPHDDVRWYNQQIRLWEEALAENEKEKLNADLERNISFDAGATYNYSQSNSNSMTHSQKFEVAVNTTSNLFVGAIIQGSGGEFAFTLGLNAVTGGAFSESSQTSNGYSYSLSDDNTGDFFSVDVKKDGHGNGPVFSLRGGQSMCPWEQGEVTKYYHPGTALSESTIRRELPQLDVEPSYAANVPEHQSAKFKLKMRNASPTGDIQWYGLRVLDQTNPYGAKLSIDGASPNRVFEIPAGTTLEKTLLLTKADSDFYEIKLMLYSTCEYDAYQNGGVLYSSDTITISAQFVPACSPVSIRMPNDLWINNVDDNNTLLIQMEDYELDGDLENLQLQYKPSFTSVWKGLQTFWTTVPPGSTDPEIPPGSSILSYNWDISELPDGPYDIRAVSHCSTVQNDYASPAVSGVIDRIRPHAFGNPQPADGVLDPNDEILIQFNEEINPASVIPANIDVKAVLNGSPLRHETSVQLDGVNDYVEIPPGTRIGGEPFTVEMWAKRLSGGAAILWSQGEKADSSMTIGFNASDVLYFQWYNTTVLSGTAIPADGQWYHLAVTCNEGGQVNFYVTGIFVGTGFLLEMPSIPGNMAIGKAAWADQGHYHGYIHEARIWKSELTEGMIRTQMLKRLSGSEAGLSMLWPMDEGIGTVVHDIVRKKNATLHGDWAVLPSGKSFVFHGADYLSVDAGTMVFTTQHSFSIEFWMKGMKTADYQTFISNGKGDGSDAYDGAWSISGAPDGKLMIFHGGQTFTAVDKDVLDDNWHHIAIVMNRFGNLNTYLDGLLQSSTYGDAFGEFAAASLWIGSRGWLEGVVEHHDQFFDGAMDEIRIWNSRLTAEEIQATMSNRLAGDEFGLMFYLPFESYTEVGGVPVLTEDLVDHSMFNRTIMVTGMPSHQEEDPNIKLVAPFEKVNFTYTINGDKVLITPTTDPLRIEGTVLYISIKGVEDLHGNVMAGPVNWTAYVNKNQLQWEESELSFDKPEKQPLQFSTKIVNSGGIALSYEILNLPDWLTATPSVGTIDPVSEKTIQFEISPNVPIGDYSADINLLSGQGYNDKLILDLHVFGVPPEWQIDPSDYAYSMNVVADLDIKGELSDDPLDRVVAYIDGEVRGLTTMEYIPELDRYLGFLEVYSNETSGQNVSFKVWDASTGTTYAGVNIKVGTQQNLEIPFVANTLVGDAVTPARWMVTSDIIQEIPVNAGWTWISFNVLSPKFDDLDAFFAELNFEDGDQVLSQTKNANYVPSTGWQGNLMNQGLEITKMYKCNFTYADILRVVGPAVNPALYPITIISGWNWIPYLSRERIEVNEALSSFNATAGDQIKSQDQFAVYHPSQGWVGTLRYLEPGKGYMLFADNAGSIIYPLQAQLPDVPVAAAEEPRYAIKWRSGHSQEPLIHRARNMTMIATLESEKAFATMPSIAAFAGEQLLQVIQPIKAADSDQWKYFFTLQGESGQDLIHFEVYDTHGQYAGIAEEYFKWDADLRIGTCDKPFILHLRQPGDPLMSVQPNPFTDLVEILVDASNAGDIDIHVYDMSGTLVFADRLTATKPGLHRISWDGHGMNGSPVAPGVYVVEVRSAGKTQYEKLVKQ